MSTSKAAAGRGYHHGDLRRALVRAAGELVERGGPAAVSLREAARAAGVSHAAPYRHFDSREALLAAVAADGFRQLLEALRAVEAAGGERLPALGRAYVDFAIACPGLYQLMFSEAVSKAAHPDLWEASRAAMAPLRDAVAGQAKGQGGRLETVAAWALVHGLAHLLVQGQIATDLAEAAPRERLVKAALAIFTRGLAATP